MIDSFFAGLPDCRLDHRHEPLVLERLFEEVHRAEFHRLDRERDVAMAGHHQNREAAASRLHALQQFDAVNAGHPYVRHHATEAERGQVLEKRLRVLEQNHLEAGGIEQEVERIPHRLVVIDHIDLGPFSHHAQPWLEPPAG